MHMATMYAQLPSLSCDDWMTCALKLKAVSHGPAAASCRASRPFPDMCDLFVLCVRNYLSVLLLKLTAILHLISLGVAGMMSHSFIHPSIHSIFHSLIHSFTLQTWTDDRSALNLQRRAHILWEDGQPGTVLIVKKANNSQAARTLKLIADWCAITASTKVTKHACQA